MVQFSKRCWHSMVQVASGDCCILFIYNLRCSFWLSPAGTIGRSRIDKTGKLLLVHGGYVRLHPERFLGRCTQRYHVGCAVNMVQ